MTVYRGREAYFLGAECRLLDSHDWAQSQQTLQLKPSQLSSVKAVPVAAAEQYKAWQCDEAEAKSKADPTGQQGVRGTQEADLELMAGKGKVKRVTVT